MFLGETETCDDNAVYDWSALYNFLVITENYRCSLVSAIIGLIVVSFIKGQSLWETGMRI